MVGCGSPPSASRPSGSQLQTVKVGIMPIPDCVTVPLANMRGYFEDEGLQVEIETVQGGGVALPKLKSGALSFSIMNYTAAVLAESQQPGTLRIVADAYQSAPNTFKLMVAKNSPIKGLADLRGKHIAVVTLRSVGTLTTEAALKISGLTADDVRISELPLPDMIPALQTGKIDVAWMTEPFITAYQQLGGQTLYDVMQGQTENWPIAGWATTTDYAKNHPRQVVAFQRAILKAQADAQNRQVITDTLPTYTKIGPETAATITLGTFPMNLHPDRIQRVADVMLEHQYITGELDVSRFLMPPPATVGHSPAPPPPPATPSTPAATPSKVPTP
ncbi:ABC transporter substrate-binding protein [Nonomuraea sp. CA-218870]|uniref:ABC transporter substrate-binding protein n=1 Tax=Nonomuraea corallina TaxID=2989783 RepID=A0ABT4SAY3_9ACTN|nr:ABC transporter substrate-binding protein [Nonomuraea corallina]MDA0634366.1 ABC transporter substrate-binding protein [Nonomuraea corallina]